MTDRHDPDRSETEPTDDDPSVFDLFEPPPPSDPRSFGKIPVIKDAEIDLTDGASSAERKAAADAEAAGLQHWTAPPTGQLPAVLSDKDAKNGLWGDVAGPSWHGDDPTWSGPDLADVFADTDAVRLGDYIDDEDDEEEDDEYRRPAPSSAAPATIQLDDEPMDRSMPPLAAAPERRTPSVDPGSQRPEGAAVQDWASIPRSPRPAHRDVPSSSPRPRPGVARDDSNWPTSSETLGSGRTEAEPPVAGTLRTPRLEADSPARAPRREEPAGTLGADRRPDPDRRPDADRPVPRSPALRDDPRSPRMRRPEPALDPGTRFGGSAGHDREAPASGRAGLFDDERGVPSIDDIDFGDPDPGRQATAVHDRGQPEADHHDYDGLDDLLDSGAGRRGGRNVPAAIGVGVGLVAVLLGVMWLGPEATLLLVLVLAVLAVVELYNAMRLAGLRPATLLGIVATAAAPAAAFFRGDAAMPLVIGLSVVFGFLWYLVGADTERPVLNLSLTMMGILWIGGLASFAGLMLRVDGDLGIELLLAAIIITVTSDTMAYVGGRAYGARPFHPASPNKTWEGTLTGFLGAVFAGFAIGAVGMGSLWDDNLLAAIALGAVVGLLAPIGDLAESVVKRDLGVKDMGHLLPGHGGVLDRVDALLFALPGAYYLALVGGLI